MNMLSALSALFVLAVSTVAASPVDDAAIATLETRTLPVPAGAPPTAAKTLSDRMKEGPVPAVSVAFIEDGKVKWARAYGVAELGSARAVTPDTLFQAASMSKAVAAAGALRLVDQGRLALDEDVNARLKGWQVPPSEFTVQEKVTLRRLLSHTAGLTVSGFPGYAQGAAVPSTVQVLRGEAPANTAPVRSFARPGGPSLYSGGGFTVAQLLMEEAAGEDFPALLDRLVLSPVGMRRSAFAQPLPARLARTAASGHDAKGPVPGGANTYPEYAAAGLWTTPSDYGRFVIALQDSWAGRPGALLKPETARAMVTPVANSYGLGVGLVQIGGRPAISHGGSNRGFRCQFIAFLDGSRQGIVVMTNADGGGLLGAQVLTAVSEAYGWPKPDASSGPPQQRAPSR